MQGATISPIFVKMLLEGASLKGYSPEEILRVQGLPTQLLSNNKLRISTLSFAELFHSVIQLLRDESFGLMEKPQVRGTFKYVTYACAQARDVRESLKIWRDVVNIIDGSLKGSIHLDDNGGYAALHCQRRKGVRHQFITETSLTTLHRVHCWLSNEFLPIEKVELAYPEPSFSEEYRFLFYGAPVLFGQKRNALHFSHGSLNMPVRRSRDELDELIKNVHVRLITQPRRSTSIPIKIRLWMENIFRDGSSSPHLVEAAKHVGMSEQTLRRHLKKDGYSFQQLKEDTRRDMAIHFINGKQYSVEEIAFKLGFSEASTFIRAFKKWTGVTPLAYRKL
ncbi:AraC family transcriptional regulator [Pseudomaricurvus alkylphenolicus]|uniref:AraC family transcriptional regulator n=1 Tax=Pseudomaricurvus alkylphenolicus TaxID=1306991 RepID=UPI001422D09B|nr:AraC family transcriptional regulator [Pseudomaricurvus alkylphenolicus]NIB41527.1 AraC family transcriptional regulator [Pseudomaricurvus alkylphenolicus]